MEPTNPTESNAVPTASTPQPLMKRPMRRRQFMLLLLAFVIFGYFYFRRKPPRFETQKKIVLLGFDGCDIRLVDKWWDEMPNLQRLAQMGSRASLRSTVPPESPVAWSSFAVGANPGQHGVYDFLRRPVGAYTPTVESFVERDYPKFLFKEIPIKMPKAINRRGGVAFWDILSQKGVETTMLEVPCTFPAPKLSHGRVLSGLGVPDIRGLQATFHSFFYPPESEEKSTTFGGKVKALEKEKDSDYFLGEIIGPYSPVVDEIKRGKEKEWLETDLTWCEWKAHLMTFHGKLHVQPEDRRSLEIYFAKRVVEPYALRTYLHTDDLTQRIEAVKLHVHTGIDFVKKPGANASEAREHMADALTQSKKLEKEVIETIKEIKAPVRFRPIDAETVEIKIEDQVKQAKLREWSDWFTVSFPITRLISVQAVCRFYPQSIQPEIDIFMTSPDIDPRNPAISISHPSAYSKQLSEWVGGPYKTRGWCEETHGLKDGYLSEEGFMEDLLAIMQMREAKTFETLERTDNNVLISVFSETDRVAHMFYHCIDEQHPLYTPELAQKYGDYMKKIYLRMDEIVGRMMEKVKDDPDTLLIVMSDHGFSSWRYQVNLNTWLWENKFLVRKKEFGKEKEFGTKKLEDLESRTSEYFEDVDWSQTQAYSLGLGQIYINMKGREPLGIVEPGTGPGQYADVCNRICTELAKLTDNREGRDNAPVFSYVKKRDEIWTGPYANDDHDCPDIQTGFNWGYRVSWQTCLGGIEPVTITDNPEKWSGDHCSLATEQVPGMFFCNRKINKSEVSIYDFAPTILRYFGLEPTEAMEGEDLAQTNS